MCTLGVLLRTVALSIDPPRVVRQKEAGGVCDQLVHQADLIATFADIVATDLPDDAGEHSVSLVPLWKGEDKPLRETAVSGSIRGVPGVRQETWKFIPAPGSGGGSTRGDDRQAVQLYNLDTDLGERQNMADKNPMRVTKMKGLLGRSIETGCAPGSIGIVGCLLLRLIRV